MEIELRNVPVTDPDLAALVARLDQFFEESWGEAMAGYAPYHNLAKMACAIVAYIDGAPAGCGCWKPYGAATAEMKRMFVLPERRRAGVAARIIGALEADAKRRGCTRAVLETGAQMPGAVAFYKRQGYRVVPNYGDFVGDELCVCMEKTLCE